MVQAEQQEEILKLLKYEWNVENFSNRSRNLQVVEIGLKHWKCQQQKYESSSSWNMKNIKQKKNLKFECKRTNRTK